MLDVVNLTISYGSASPVNNLSFRIQEGTTALVGPSGSGKSSLLRVLAGQQRPTRGQVLLKGEPIRVASWLQPADQRVSLIHQDYRLVPFLTVEENIRLASELKGGGMVSDQVSQLLERVRLPASFLTRFPQSLSGGEQQRVAIARALAADVQVLFADEPTGALDSENTLAIAELFGELAENSRMCILVATHDPIVAGKLVSNIDLRDASTKGSIQ